MAFKNTSVTFKNDAMHEATTRQAENCGDRNRSAYIERLIKADIQINGTEEIKSLIRNEYITEKEVN